MIRRSRSYTLATAAAAFVAASTSTALAAESGNILRSHINELFTLPMVPLWLCSFVLLTLIFERFTGLRARKILDPSLGETIAELVADLRLEDAHEAAKESKTVVGQAWAQGFHEFLLGGVSLHEALTNTTVLAFKPLKRNLQGIATISVISPLLGLLGTVVGMILVFDVISVSVDTDKQDLSAGIMVALFTTVFGLIIAIPGIIFGRYFSARIVRYAELVEADIDRIRYRHAHAVAARSSDGGEA